MEGYELETLKWARENGCPLVDEETRMEAAEELGYVDDFLLLRRFFY